VSDPEETAPFTHQPYGKGKHSDENPFVSPSGPAAEPSGPGYLPPPPPPPPTVGPVPYGAPTASQPYPGQPYGYQPGWTPAYGAPYAGSQDHKGATTSLVLGIISIASLVLGLGCCFIMFPGLLCAPVAWVIGAKAKREIQQQPGLYGNLGSAQAGMWMGIVMTIIGFFVIAGAVALFAWVGFSNPSLV
jgi:hypothetical protein